MIPRVARSLNVFHPGVAFLYFVLAMTFIFMFYHPAFIATSLLFAVLHACYLAGTGIVLKRLRFALLFCVLPVIFVPLINHRGTHVLFYMLERPITLEAVSYALYTVCMLLSMFAAFISLNAVVSSSKLLYLFSGAAPQTAFIANMTLRFSSVLKTKGLEFMGVQQIRERLSGGGTFAGRIKRQGGMLAAFSLWTLEDGVAVSETLRAKAYGQFKRTHYESFIVTKRDFLLGAALLALAAALTVLKLFFMGKYDYFQDLANIQFNAGMSVAYTLLILFFCIPFLFDAVQMIRKAVYS